MGRLKGKVAIITGAASGMGAYEMKLFAKEGAYVIATDIDYQRLKNLIVEYDLSKSVIPLKHNVSEIADWQMVLERTIEEFAKVDILINNAGIYIPQESHEFSIDIWEKTMSINSLGVILGMHVVIPFMLSNGQGSIVNIASIDSNVGTGNSTIYTASKGAVRSMTKKVAIDYAGNKIRVNSIHPGLVVTPMTFEQINNKGSFAQSNTPLPYLGEPSDIAYGALYLASDESKYITGTELIIDGGLTAL